MAAALTRRTEERQAAREVVGDGADGSEPPELLPDPNDPNKKNFNDESIQIP